MPNVILFGRAGIETSPLADGVHAICCPACATVLPDERRLSLAPPAEAGGPPRRYCAACGEALEIISLPLVQLRQVS